MTQEVAQEVALVSSYSCLMARNALAAAMLVTAITPCTVNFISGVPQTVPLCQRPDAPRQSSVS